ncbi:SRPBCC family protein [Streptomyces sp. NBC_01614]|uniref:SRPBCC family protein n=1 Tax=Streptomyces sp. NBC_01614 TaxID=2975897 RepID=UPI003863992B
MDWSHYRFRSLWALPAPPGTVYDLLEQAEGYPRWWPQVREVNRLDDTSGVITIRSVLPYDMTFTAREVRRERGAGVLEIAMSGDLDGWVRWTVTVAPDGSGTIARYEQVVDVNKPLLRRLAVPGRPVFRANHWLMMRSGRRGLAAHLARARQGGHDGGHQAV